MSVAYRAALSAVLFVLAIAPVAALGHGPSHQGRDDGSPRADTAAQHSLRAPVTDQNFYFVMPDRFDNGSIANDNGGLPPARARASRGSTRRARAGTTAATSRASGASLTMSRASGPPRSG